MRKQSEINQAVALLRKKGDVLSLAQVGVLEDKRTEAWVFNTYVRSVPEDRKNEAEFYAARDAARFMAGSLTLEELMPDVEIDSIPLCSSAEETGSITLSRKDYNQLINRLERLEQWVGFKRKPTTVTPAPMPVGMDMTDMMMQSEACAYLRCSKLTIKKLAAQKKIHVYQKDRNVYYSKKELDKKVVAERNVKP